MRRLQMEPCSAVNILSWFRAKQLFQMSILETLAVRGFCSSVLAMVTGRFLVLTDRNLIEDGGVSSSARDNLVNECTNMGLLV